MWQADVGNAIKWGEDTEIAEVKERQPALLQQLLKIWEQSVRATHHFLSSREIEQNPEAKGFYEHMGFCVYKRTDCDEQGAPYPLLYMEISQR